MDAIEQMDPARFSQYLKEYENTICGRYPIGVLLSVSWIIISFGTDKVLYKIKQVWSWSTIMQNTDILRFGFASLSVDLNNTKILQTVRNQHAC